MLTSKQISIALVLLLVATSAYAQSLDVDFGITKSSPGTCPSSVTSSSFTIPAGDTIVVQGTWGLNYVPSNDGQQSLSSITDTLGNTWTTIQECPVGNQACPNMFGLFIAWANNSVGGSDTITANFGFSTDPTFCSQAFDTAAFKNITISNVFNSGEFNKGYNGSPPTTTSPTISTNTGTNLAFSWGTPYNFNPPAPNTMLTAGSGGWTSMSFMNDNNSYVNLGTSYLVSNSAQNIFTGWQASSAVNAQTAIFSLNGSTPTPTPTPQPTNSPTPTAGPTQTNSPTPTASQTPVPTQTPTPTATPVPTATPTPVSSLCNPGSLNSNDVCNKNAGGAPCTLPVAAGTTPKQILPVNNKRNELIVANTGPVVAYVSLGLNVATNDFTRGIAIQPEGTAGSVLDISIPPDPGFIKHTWTSTVWVSTAAGSTCLVYGEKSN